MGTGDSAVVGGLWGVSLLLLGCEQENRGGSEELHNGESDKGAEGWLRI